MDKIVERREPSSSSTVESEVIVPLAQSSITGLVLGLVWLTGSILWHRIDLAPYALIITIVTMAVVWLMLLREHRSLLWKLETITRTDLDGDRFVGRPTADPDPMPITTVEIVDQAQGRIRYVDLPITDEVLELLARAVLMSGQPFSRRNLHDAGVLHSEQYGPVSTAMIAAGLVRYKGNGPNTGMDLTPSGRSFLRQYL